MIGGEIGDGKAQKIVDDEKVDGAGEVRSDSPSSAQREVSAEPASTRADVLSDSGRVDEFEVRPKIELAEDDFRGFDLNAEHLGLSNNEIADLAFSEIKEQISEDSNASQNKETWMNGLQIGDMVWGKVKSHPWWPGHIFDEGFAKTIVPKSKKEGHVLVAFFGDSSYGWFDPAELIPFEPHFAEKSKQSTLKNFTKAVEEAVDEASRRSALGVSCRCHGLLKIRPISVPGYFSVDVAGFEPDGIYSSERIAEARESFFPSKALSFLKQAAAMPLEAELWSIEGIKQASILVATRRGRFEKFDRTYAEAFGGNASKNSQDVQTGAEQPGKMQSRAAPLSGPMVIAEPLGERHVPPTPVKKTGGKHGLKKREDAPAAELVNPKKIADEQAPPPAADEKAAAGVAASTTAAATAHQRMMMSATENEAAVKKKKRKREPSLIEPPSSKKNAATAYEWVNLKKVADEQAPPPASDEEAAGAAAATTVAAHQRLMTSAMENGAAVKKKKRKREPSIIQPPPLSKKNAAAPPGAAQPPPVTANPPSKKIAALAPAAAQPPAVAQSPPKVDLSAALDVDLPNALSELTSLAVDPFHGPAFSARHMLLSFRALVFEKGLPFPPPKEYEPFLIRKVGTAREDQKAAAPSPPPKPQKVAPPSSRAEDPTKSGRKRLAPPDRADNKSTKKTKKSTHSVLEKKVNPQAKPESEPPMKNQEATPTFLIMKFPHRSTLPSISSLKARFARFGPLDLSGTCVLWKLYTCKVLFKHKADAQAALSHAQSNEIFGQVKVNYSLRDPDLPELAAPPKPSQTQPKSILKKPAEEGGAVKETQRVKFLLGEPPVVVSNAASQENPNRKSSSSGNSVPSLMTSADRDVDFYRKMLSLLTRCSDIVTDVKSALGYVPYHPL